MIEGNADAQNLCKSPVSQWRMLMTEREEANSSAQRRR